jgi:hypothetical protein
MPIHPKRVLLIGVRVLVLAGFLFSLLIPAPVWAGGAQPALPGAASLQPEEETPVQLAAEVVNMTIRPATEADNALVRLNPKTYSLQRQGPVWYPAIAETQADFTLRNPTGLEVSLPILFPLASALETVDWNLNPRYMVPRLESFQVTVDGKPIAYMVSELPNPKGPDLPLLPWASFPVAFPAGAETHIRLSYLFPLLPSMTGIEMALYYVFSSAAGWAGPVNSTELVLNLPYPASADTLAGMPPGDLRLPPYYRPSLRAELPSGLVLEGNQARWTWQEREPGAGEDFTIWLLQPDRWQELEAARAAVQASPRDGHAWLDLASSYYFLSWPSFDQPLSIFSSSYLSVCFQSFRKAASMLPDHPAAHAGLALAALAPHMAEADASAQEFQFVQDELRIATQLDARDPTWAKKAGSSGRLLAILKGVVNLYDKKSATATAASTAEQTAHPVLQATVTPTPTRLPTPTLLCSPTPPPVPTASPVATAGTSGNGQSTLIVVAAGVVIGLALAVFLALKRKRKQGIESRE